MRQYDPWPALEVAILANEENHSRLSFEYNIVSTLPVEQAWQDADYPSCDSRKKQLRFAVDD